MNWLNECDSEYVTIHNILINNDPIRLVNVIPDKSAYKQQAVDVMLRCCCFDCYDDLEDELVLIFDYWFGKNQCRPLALRCAAEDIFNFYESEKMKYE